MMIARFVKTLAASMLVVGAVLAFQSAAWCQSCGTAGASASNSCSEQGAKCSTTSNAGKPVLHGVCKTVAKPGGDSTCACVDAKGGIISSGTHALAFGSKGGGAGTIAISTLLGLVALWCLGAIWKSRKTTWG